MIEIGPNLVEVLKTAAPFIFLIAVYFLLFRER